MDYEIGIVKLQCKRCKHIQRHSMTNIYYACCSHCKTSINVMKNLIKEENAVRESFVGSNEQVVLQRRD